MRKLRAHAEQKEARTIQLVDAKTQTCALDVETQSMEGGLYISYIKDYVRKQISFPAASKNENPSRCMQHDYSHPNLTKEPSSVTLRL